MVMKSLTKSLFALPLFGVALLWGVSMVATPVKATSLDGIDAYTLVAAYKAEARSSASSTSRNLTTTQSDESNVRGTVVRFLEGSELIIDDGNGRIVVDYQDRWRPLNLHVGDRVTIRGNLQGSGESREVLAEEILAPRGRVYPQPERFNRLLEDRNLRNHISLADTSTSSGAIAISDVLFNTNAGEMVTVDGEVFELPEETILILRDSSGTIVVDIDDAQSSLNLQKGDLLSVSGKVTSGTSGKNELQAMSIEKKNSSSY
jgi:uncharacterized protein YdeI (BOF family)